MPAWADTLRGVVIVVIDGDTVLFRPDDYGTRSRAFIKLRLADIDAPEQDQAGGEASTRALASLVLKQAVDVKIVATDVYGRAIAVLEHRGTQINTEMVRLGHAWITSRGRNRPALDGALNEARRAKRGIWADADSVPPWVWRRGPGGPAY
ncbi:MAG: thermonuclease family protein [Thiobacillus sp.]|nr:thermonuclease family protein [Thiobacillus sp.]